MEDESKRNFLGGIGAVVLSTAVGGIFTSCVNSFTQLRENDFHNVKWFKITNYKGVVHECYMGETAHEGNSWNTFLDKVYEKNRGNLRGETILLPDLNRDGKLTVIAEKGVRHYRDDEEKTQREKLTERLTKLTE